MNNIVFLDIDGTIVDTTRGLYYPSKKTKHSVKQLQDHGDYVILSSGRPRYLLDEEIIRLGADGMILSNGSYIELQGAPLYERYLDQDELKELQRFIIKKNAMCLYEKQESLLFQGNSKLLNEFSKLWNMELVYEERSPNKDDQVYKLSVSFPDKESSDLFISEFKDRFDIRTQSNHIAYDVGPRFISKGKAVEKILNELRIDRINAYAFGDGINDLEMLQSVEHPFAMKNSEAELLNEIDVVVDDVVNDGVYKKLRELALIN